MREFNKREEKKPKGFVKPQAPKKKLTQRMKDKAEAKKDDKLKNAKLDLTQVNHMLCIKKTELAMCFIIYLLFNTVMDKLILSFSHDCNISLIKLQIKHLKHTVPLGKCKNGPKLKILNIFPYCYMYKQN